MIKQFLEQSNNIEGVFDSDSLKQAVKAWDYIAGQKKITADVILKTHGILMLNHLPVDERGCFRHVEVTIGGIYGMHHLIVPEMVDKWCMRANKPRTANNIKRDHVRFEKIHPFVDGNGRTGRILLNHQRLINKLSILVIKNSEKQDYYKWFR